MRPDRVVVGAETEMARDVMRALYRPLFLIETPILFTNLETSELIKYASNAFLAVKVHTVQSSHMALHDQGQMELHDNRIPQARGSRR